MIRYAFAYSVIYVLWLLRRVISTDGRSYILLFGPQFQPILRWIARLRAYAIFYKASRKCPAYQKFLAAENFGADGKTGLSNIPIMTKENYVKVYSIRVIRNS